MILNYALMVFLVLEHLLFFIERKDLYNRLHSKDSNEYKRTINQPKGNHIDAHRKVMDKWKRGDL